MYVLKINENKIGIIRDIRINESEENYKEYLNKFLHKKIENESEETKEQYEQKIIKYINVIYPEVVNLKINKNLSKLNEVTNEKTLDDEVEELLSKNKESKIKKGINKVKETSKNIVTKGKEKTKTTIDKVKESNIIKSVKNTGSKILSGTKKVLLFPVRLAKKGINKVKEKNIKETVKNTGSKILSGTKKILSFPVTLVKKGINKVKENINKKEENLINELEEYQDLIDKSSTKQDEELEEEVQNDNKENEPSKIKKLEEELLELKKLLLKVYMTKEEKDYSEDLEEEIVNSIGEENIRTIGIK